MASDLPSPVRFHTRTTKIEPPGRLVRRADLQHVALMGLYRLATKLLPPHRWSLIADAVSRLRRGLSQRRLEQFGERFRAVYGHELDPDTLRAWYRGREKRQERRRLYLAVERRPGPWNPAITLDGIDAVDAALGEGKGVVLWFDDFIHHNIVAKKGLHAAGYRIHYLSSVLHGDSISTFGLRRLNPIQIAIESRYVAERLVLNGTGPRGGNEIACTRRMVEILKQNGIVGIANVLTSGSRLMQVPFGASACLAMPTAPANLALQRGAALFPVATIETEPLMRYTVMIGPRLILDPSRSKDAALADAGLQYCERLLALAKAHPEQWLGWRRRSLLV